MRISTVPLALSVFTRRTFPAALTVLAFSLVVVTAASANLILNPGFEADFNGDTNPNNWNFTAGDRVKDFDLGIAPHSGNLQWQFQNDFATLTQAVTLTDAGFYELSMFIANRDDPVNHLNTVASGQVTFELLDNTLTPIVPSSSVSTDYDAPRGTYVQWTRTFNFLTPGNYTVRVATGNGPGANQGMADDFSLVPEPSTALLTGMGLVALSAMRRSRARNG